MPPRLTIFHAAFWHSGEQYTVLQMAHFFVLWGFEHNEHNLSSIRPIGLVLTIAIHTKPLCGTKRKEKKDVCEEKG